MSKKYTYCGNELEIFALATNWKNYWSSKLKKYIYGRVLEVGAGIGENFQYLDTPGCKSWTAIEPDKLNCQQAKCKYSAIGKYNLITGCVSDLPNYDKYNTILYIDVLEHIFDDSKELDMACNLLTNDGCIVILSPAHNMLYSKFDRSVGHFRRYSKKSLSHIIPKQCFVQTTFYLDSVGLFASAYSRIISNSELPTVLQIKLWDRFIIPLSRVIDFMFGYTFGKTIVSVIRLKDE